MSIGYQKIEHDKLYFLLFQLVNWVDRSDSITIGKTVGFGY